MLSKTILGKIRKIKGRVKTSYAHDNIPPKRTPMLCLLMRNFDVQNDEATVVSHFSETLVNEELDADE